MNQLRFSFFFVLLLPLLPIATPAAHAGQGTFEILVGEYFADSTIDEEPVIGVRGGYRFSEHFALQGSLARVDNVHPVFTPFSDDSAVFLDLSAIWYANPGKRAELMLYGGPGVVSYETRQGCFVCFDNDGHLRNTYDSEDLATLHAGIGLQINLSPRFYLRPDVKARWIEGFSSSDGFERSEADFEATFAVGWKFGKL